MNRVQIAAPTDLQGAFSTTAKTTKKLKTPTITNDQRNSLFVLAYSELRDLAFETHQNLTCMDCETILEALAGRLRRYRGPAEPPIFIEWASKFVVQEAQRYLLLHKVLGEYRSAIFSVINLHMWNSASGQDRSIEAEDLFSGVADYLFKHAHDFNKPGYLKEDKHGRVKQLTRVCALARRHVWFYFNSPLKKRMKRIDENFAAGMKIVEAERLSEAEIAAMRPPEGAWDAGYSSLGMLE